MPTIPCECEMCHAPFTVSPSRLRGGRRVRFCSRACMTAAQRTGVLVCNGPTSRRRRWHWEPWQEQLVRETYDTRTNAVVYLQQHLPFPKHAIQTKARALGLGKKLGAAHRPWTDDDLEYLHAHLATMAWRDLARQLGRTVTAVRLAAKRAGIAKTSDGYTLRQLEPLLGMDAHKILRMIQRGYLHARRKHTDAVRDYWHVTDEALKAFIVAHREHVDLRRVDRDWFIELLTSPLLGRARHTPRLAQSAD